MAALSNAPDDRLARGQLAREAADALCYRCARGMPASMAGPPVVETAAALRTMSSQSVPGHSKDLPDQGLPPDGAAQRSYVVILFADLCESSQLAEAMEAEQTRELLHLVRDAYAEVIDKHGGSVARLQGDGVLAIFGHPDARENDGRRATHAALELHERVRNLRFDSMRLPRPLRLHTGIHSGWLLLEEGGIRVGSLDAFGSPTNVASRLSTAAGEDEILVNEQTLGPELSFFVTGPTRKIKVKGRFEPITVLQVLNRTSVHTSFEARVQRGLTPFVGRQAELRRLKRCLVDTIQGEAHFVAVEASAGVGKTRLIEEFLRAAAAVDCQVFRGYCESYLSAEPLQPFLQMLRSLFRIDHLTDAVDAEQSVETVLREFDPALLRHKLEILRALSLAKSESENRQGAAPEALVAAFRDLFQKLAERQPVVLFIDDWQWADDASNQMLNAIRAFKPYPIFVLVSTRELSPRDLSLSAAEVLKLSVLSENESAEAVSWLLPRGDPFLARRVVEYAGGNPLYLEELCHVAAQEGGERRLGGLHGDASWLTAVIVARVAELPTAQAQLVRTAAVIGPIIPAWLFQSLTGYAEDSEEVGELAKKDLIYRGEIGGTLRFKHGITRDVIYKSVGMDDRKRLHLRIAAQLRERAGTEPHEVYETLAYHYAAGGDAALAAEYAELSGDKAVAASALDRAKTQYRAALKALEELEPSSEVLRRRLSIASRLGLACVFDASRDELEVFQKAAALAEQTGDARANARAQYWLGYINYALGEARDALLYCERAFSAARDAGDEPLAVQIQATLGQARAAACDYDEALRLLDSAIAIKRKYLSGARPAVGLAYSLACRAYVLGDQGLFTDAYACFDEALRVIRDIDHEVKASILGWRAAVLLWQGRWEDARQVAAEAQRVGEQVRSLYSFSMSKAAGGYAVWMSEGRPECLQLVVDATSWLDPREGDLFKSLNYGWLADGMVTAGRTDEAKRYAERALVQEQKRDLLGLAMAYRALARAAGDAQQWDSVQQYLALAMKTALSRTSRHEVAVTQLCEAELAAARGDRGQAERLLDAATPAFEAMDMRWHLERAGRTRRAAEHA
jgi:class 3 adenylate cyclase/tetratricopeptide (TPR) repeat protein